MKAGYIRFNGLDEGKITRESKHLKEAGCEAIIVEKIAMDEPPLKLDAYLAGVKEGDELIACSFASLSQRKDVLVNTIKTLRAAKAEFTSLQQELDLSDPQTLQFLEFSAKQEELEDQLFEQEQ